MSDAAPEPVIGAVRKATGTCKHCDEAIEGFAIYDGVRWHPAWHHVETDNEVCYAMTRAEPKEVWP